MFKFVYYMMYTNCIVSFFALMGRSIETGMPVTVALIAFFIEAMAATILLVGALRGLNE